MTIDAPPSPTPRSRTSRAPDRPADRAGRDDGRGQVDRRPQAGALLDLPFADADDEIEQAAQMSVSRNLRAFGEDYFRDGERRVIARLLESGPAVIATGGGAFVQPETRAR
jgi:shikimate kinase